MHFEWWHWASLGVLLVVAELMAPAFVLVWFGLGALLVALAVAFQPELSFILQIMIWIVSSVAFVVLWFKVFKPANHKTMSGRSSAQAVGEVGLLIKDVEPFKNGQVRFQTPLMGSDVWDCVSDETIKAGERVKVVSVEGSLVKIMKTGGHA